MSDTLRIDKGALAQSGYQIAQHAAKLAGVHNWPAWEDIPPTKRSFLGDAVAYAANNPADVQACQVWSIAEGEAPTQEGLGDRFNELHGFTKFLPTVLAVVGATLAPIVDTENYPEAKAEEEPPPEVEDHPRGFDTLDRADEPAATKTTKATKPAKKVGK